jgi:hypothetical protein
LKSPNKKPMTFAEREHVAKVKLLPCVICGVGGGEAAPSEAHEIEQGSWFTAVALCADCHRGENNGWHGRRRMWSVMKHTELSALNETIRMLML